MIPSPGETRLFPSRDLEPVSGVCWLEQRAVSRAGTVRTVSPELPLIDPRAVALVNAVIDDGEYEVADSVRQVVELAVTQDLLLIDITKAVEAARNTDPLSKTGWR
jgi:hypothetical protein